MKIILWVAILFALAVVGYLDGPELHSVELTNEQQREIYHAVMSDREITAMSNRGGATQ